MKETGEKAVETVRSEEHACASKEFPYIFFKSLYWLNRIHVQEGVYFTMVQHSVMHQCCTREVSPMPVCSQW